MVKGSLTAGKTLALPGLINLIPNKCTFLKFNVFCFEIFNLLSWYNHISTRAKNFVLVLNIAFVLVAGNRAKDLVKQILAFSRQAEVQRIPIQIQSLIKEALKMLRSSLPTTIEIHDDIDSRCGAVLADPTQVHQILMNLCTNASYAMEETGGILRIELKSVCIDKGSHRQVPLNMESG